MRDSRNHREIIRPSHQGHDTEITEFQSNTLNTLNNIDGIYTKEYHKQIGALCADCPIIICMGKGECAVIHSGWRGTKKHIIRHALELFSTPLGNIQIFIGPHI